MNGPRSLETSSPNTSTLSGPHPPNDDSHTLETAARKLGGPHRLSRSSYGNRRHFKPYNRFPNTIIHRTRESWLLAQLEMISLHISPVAHDWTRPGRGTVTVLSRGETVATPSTDPSSGNTEPEDEPVSGI